MRGKYRMAIRKHTSRNITAVICLAAGVAALQASTVLPMNLRELAGQAARVAVGRIDRIESFRDAASGHIHSRVEVAETRSLTGAPLGRLTFEMTGGRVGDLQQWIAGMPQLAEGDEVVLFLAGSTQTPLGPTVGLWQGIFFVENERITDHRRRPIAAIRGDEIVRAPEPRPGAVAQGAPSLSLDQFLAQVRAFRQLPRAAGNR